MENNESAARKESTAFDDPLMKDPNVDPGLGKETPKKKNSSKLLKIEPESPKSYLAVFLAVMVALSLNFTRCVESGSRHHGYSTAESDYDFIVLTEDCSQSKKMSELKKGMKYVFPGEHRSATTVHMIKSAGKVLVSFRMATSLDKVDTYNYVLYTDELEFQETVENNTVLKDRLKKIPRLSGWVNDYHSFFSYYTGINTTQGGISKYEIAILLSTCVQEGKMCWSLMGNRMLGLCLYNDGYVGVDDDHTEEVRQSGMTCLTFNGTGLTKRTVGYWRLCCGLVDALPDGRFYGLVLTKYKKKTNPAPLPEMGQRVASDLSAMKTFGFEFNYHEVHQNFFVCIAESRDKLTRLFGYGQSKKMAKKATAYFKNCPRDLVQKQTPKTSRSLLSLSELWEVPNVEVVAYAVCVSGLAYFDKGSRQIYLSPGPKRIAVDPSKHMEYILGFVKGIA